jgi:two-component system, OmpR family, sensor kinase
MAVAGTSHRAARPWRALHDLSNRTSLRTKLIIGLLALVIVAVAAISISSVWVLRSYLVSQDDGQLQSAYSIINSQGLNPLVPGDAYQWHDLLVAVQEPGTPLSPSGLQGGLPGYGGSRQAQSLPTVPTSQLWAVANQGKLLTVPAQSGPNTWRVITEPVSYQLPTPGGPEQVTGTLIIGADLGNINATIGRLAATTLIIGVIIVCILALAIVMVVRASLRPLVEIEETAGEIAAGHLNRRVPERDPRTEIGSLGQSLNTMLSQIETAFHAQEESEAAAHQSEERMRRFIADASHELRTPLTAIRGFAEYYRQRGGLVQHGDESAQKPPDAMPAETNGEAAAADAEAGLTAEDLDRIMHRVEAEAARMGLLVEDLLLLARLDQQRPLAQRPVDLLSLAADAVHDARLLAPTRAIDLSVQPGAAFLVIGDEPRLRQVIGNLMSNALTHTPEGTPIQVSVSTGTLDPRKSNSPSAVVLEVTDHGPGMTQEQKRRVFERFYRADQARNRSTGGSGLGLAIVNAIVGAQGGTASVRSAPGKGATFRIALPLAPEAQGGHHPGDDADPADLTDELDLTGGTASEAETVGETGEAETAGEAATAGETGTDSRAETTAGVPEQRMSQAARDKAGG